MALKVLNKYYAKGINSVKMALELSSRKLAVVTRTSRHLAPQGKSSRSSSQKLWLMRSKMYVVIKKWQ